LGNVDIILRLLVIHILLRDVALREKLFLSLEKLFALSALAWVCLIAASAFFTWSLALSTACR